MAETRRVWTVDDLAARFEEAASTGRRLPPVRVQGYFNSWPAFVRKEWEAFAANERVPPRIHRIHPHAHQRAHQNRRN